ncbi:dopey family protein [Schizosaccharomyces japonicus yFS275]|uniref:Dopey family protein n=1 Tax=Schizosaccharomyces japonicus (strain yFS275 / FY16936) TaxID=402676 RepID=B6K6K3_SCHJY|nr:dopey family protein [Schizosaccharomyces japonicus yFS275]EEB09157.2 dopey family protein [Schizosaccharomyces japonicus yFS275]
MFPVFDNSSDSKFKKYQDAIKKSLALFRTVEQWPDYISFLTKLHKVLQGNTEFHTVPCNTLVSRALAECLSPGLPSGVHKKSLEVYDFIFSSLSSDRLADELDVWIYGLTPFFAISSIKTKPDYLNIVCKHLLPLGPRLRNCFQAVFISLLPGLEEEGAESLQEILTILRSLCNSFEDDCFVWSCTWNTVLNYPEQRLGAHIYIEAALSGAQPNDWRDTISKPDPGLMVRAIAAAVGDSVSLVQRGYLDTLLNHLPVYSEIFNEVTQTDLLLLHTSVASVVLRNDLSLTRRYYSWLTGATQKSEYVRDENKLRECLEKSMKCQIKGLIDLFQNHSSIASQYKALSLLLALSEREDLFRYVEEQLVSETFSCLTRLAYSKKPVESKVVHDAAFEYGFRVISRISDACLLNFTRSLLLSYGKFSTETFMTLVFIVKHRKSFFRANYLQLDFLLTYSLLDHISTELSSSEDLESLLRCCQLLKTAVENIDWKSFNDHANFSAVKESFYDPDAIFANCFTPKKTASIQRVSEECSVLVNPCIDIIFRVIQDSALKDNMQAIMLEVLFLIFNTLNLDTYNEKLSRFMETMLKNNLLNYAAYNVLIRQAQPAFLQMSKKLLSSIMEKLWKTSAKITTYEEENFVSLIWCLQDKLKDSQLESFFSLKLARDIQLDQYDSVVLLHPFTKILKICADDKHFHAVFDRPLLLLIDILENSAYEQASLLMGLFETSNSLQTRFMEIIFYNVSSLSVSFSRKSDGGGNVPSFEINEFKRDSESSLCVYYFKLSEKFLSLQNRFAKEFKQIEANNIHNFLALSWSDLLSSLAESVNCPKLVSFLTRVCIDILRQHQQFLNEKNRINLCKTILDFLRTLLNLITLPTFIEEELLLLLLDSIQDTPTIDENFDKMLVFKYLTVIELLQERVSPKTFLKEQHMNTLIASINYGLNYQDIHICSKWIEIVHGFLDIIIRNSPMLVLSPINSLCSQLHLLSRSLKSFDRKEMASHIELCSKDLLYKKLDLLYEMISRALVQLRPSSYTKKFLHDNVGILGNVISGVFSSDVTDGSNIDRRMSMLVCFQAVIKAVFNLFLCAYEPSEAFRRSFHFSSAFNEELKRNLSHTFKKLYHCEPSECLETIIELYIQDNKGKDSVYWRILSIFGEPKYSDLFKLFSASFTAHDSPSTYSGPASLTLNISPLEILHCLSTFISNMQPEIATQVLFDITRLVREISNNPAAYRNYLLVSLEILFHMSQHLSVHGDSRQQKEFTDLWGRTLNVCLLQVNKQGDVRLNAEEYKRAKTRPLSDNESPFVRDAVFLSSTFFDASLLDFLTNNILPQLTVLSSNEDRLVVWITSIINAYLTPVLKTRSFPANFTDMHLEFLNKLTAYPGLSKSWKKEFWDIFYDNAIFQLPIAQLEGLAPTIHLAFSQEINRLSDLILKSDLGTVTIFTSKDSQLGARQSNICRMSLLVLACPKDFFLPNLSPVIDLVKRLLQSDPEGVLRKDVFLFIHALALKISSQQLLPLWSIIVSEIYIVFQLYLSTDNRAFENTLLDTCKLLDFLTVLSPEEFALHEWVYMGNPLDAVYWNRKASAKSLLQQVAEKLKLSEKPNDLSSVKTLSYTLFSKRHLSLDIPSFDVDQVQHFLTKLPIDVYEQGYSLTQPDLNLLEHSIYSAILARFSP